MGFFSKFKDVAKRMNPDFGILSGDDPQEALDPLDLFGARRSREASEKAEGLGYQSLELQRELAERGFDLQDRQLGNLESFMQDLKGYYSPYQKQAGPALEALAALSGLGGAGAEQEAIEGIKSGALYNQLLDTGNEAVMRSSAMTGGLRGGGAISDINQNAQQALLGAMSTRQGQLQDISNLSLGGLGAFTGAAGSNLGQQGAATSSYQNALSNLAQQQSGTLGSIGNIGLTNAAMGNQRAGQAVGVLGSLFSMFSDERLKTNITKIGEKHGLPWYEWEWNKTAKDKFNLEGKQQGHMVSDVEIKYPDAVKMHEGYKTVDYSALEGE